MKIGELRQLNESYSIEEVRDDEGDEQYADTAGFLNFHRKGITSLKGAPQHVNIGGCNISENKLTSLRYAPVDVKGEFNCKENRLTNLKYGPKHVEAGDYVCASNLLTSLEGAPARVNNFHCEHNLITSLKHAPTNVDGCFVATYNDIEAFECEMTLTSLGRLDLKHNMLRSLQGIHKHILQAMHINLEGNPIESHVLGLLKIANLREVVLYVRHNGKLTANVGVIINKHLRPDRRNIFDCQAELEDEGYEAFAQL